MFGWIVQILELFFTFYFVVQAKKSSWTKKAIVSDGKMATILSFFDIQMNNSLLFSEI